ncbi:MAG: GTP cyclohydrolase II [Pseudomonadota bacterium]|nr:GTP cyclohydrolase II [Pseudomonadota bacterium]
MTEPAGLDRAIAALRAGRPAALSGQPLLAVETATAAMLGLLDPEGGARLLLSGPRAAALGLGNERDAADPELPVLLQRCSWLGQGEALALADPGRDLARAPIGPLASLACADVKLYLAALALARLAGLLPALWLLPPETGVTTSLEASALDTPVRAEIVARASLPLDDLPPSQLVAFRDPASGEDHVALVIGAYGGEPPLVRLHSECLTGDVFGSLKCDCGPQLRQALALIGAAGGGVLLYLRQEGRGIGLVNKLRAYQLQDRGLDTVDANRRLGFADDERDYRMAAAMLRALGIDRVRLLTNNPAKLAGLEHEGIAVEARVAHHMTTNPHNADYIATKRAKSGHLD